MSLRATLFTIFAIGVVLLAGLGFIFSQQARIHGEIAVTEGRRYESYKVADELRQSSDDLTRMARTYVVTGDPIYEQHFNDILAIRNGEMARPRDYSGIYWDLVSKDVARPTPDGPAMALEQLMRDMEFTDIEFSTLREAQRNSDALVRLENVAMNAVKGRFDDGAGQFTVEGDPDLEMARRIMHGEAYHQAKAGIMAPIRQFMAHLEFRTERELSALRDNQRILDIVTLTLIGISVLFGLLAFTHFRRRLTQATAKVARERRKTNDRLRILGCSIITMSVIALAVGMMTIYLLHQAAFKQMQQNLVETASAQARLIEAVARFDRLHSGEDHAEGAAAATISQVVDANEHHPGIGETGEFTLARLEDNEMVFLLDWRHGAPDQSMRVPFSGSELAEPMRRALSGRSGTLISTDYRGETVLAAYEPVSELDAGIVAKIDLQEIRRPFVRAALIALGGGALFVLAGGLLLVWISNPLIKRVEDGERHVRTILNTCTEGFWFVDPDAVSVDVNPAMCGILGRPREDIVGRAVAEFLTEEDQAGRIEWLQRVKSGEPAAHEINLTRPDGATAPCFVNATPYFDESGEIVGSFAMVTDITERKKAEEQLRLQSAALQSAANAIVITDTAGAIVWINEAFTTLTGYERDEVIGQNPRFLKSGNHDQSFYQDLWETVLAGRTWHGEMINRRKDDTLYTEEMTITPVRGADGQITHFVGIKQDVTERRAAQEELRVAREAADSANESKSAFLANMSHEIRTPMNGIIGMTELALDTELDPEQRDYMDTVKSSAEALLSLINDILDFSKIEAGRMELDPIHFALRDSLADMLNTLAARAHGRGLELAYHVPPDLPDALIGDMYRVRQIVVNLVGNAIKFTSEGEIVVGVDEIERVDQTVTLRFSVRDTGIGIPADKLDAIFKPFEQADVSTTRRYGGTGLGLAISVQLAELMGGRMWADSVEGEGSTFHFSATFGLSDREVARTTAEGRGMLESLPVLVVDDNETNRRILDEMLKAWRMSPQSVDSAAAALGALDRATSAGHSFRIVVSDVNMPDMDGFELVERMRGSSTHGHVPVIFLTSASNPGDVARCRELGVAAHLFKPVKQSLLLNAIANAVAEETATSTVAAESQQSEADHGVDRTLRILLAEDNVVNQKFAVRAIERAGHSVDVANNGKEAVEAWEREPYDVVLMDVQMPEMDGYEATAAIRGSEAQGDADGRGRTPIIAMTANAMKGDRERCLEAGMDGYVSKPVKRETLFAEIDRVLSAHAPKGDS